MNRIIVTESAYNMRAKARTSLAGRWKPAVIVVLLYTLITTVPTMIFDAFFSFDMPVRTFNVAGTEYFVEGTNYSMLSAAYMILIGAPLALGMNAFFLQFYRNRIDDTNLLYSGFKMYGKSIILFALRAVFIFLWSLLLVFPGIIAYYRYSQAYYIMLDNPEKSCLECINESKRLMQGNKGRLFCLQFSFIGWILLAALPAGLVASIIMTIQGTEQFILTGTSDVDSLVFTLISFVCAAGTLWVNAYLQNANVAFYEILTGKYQQTGYAQTDNATDDLQKQTSNLDMYTGKNDLYRKNVEGKNDENDR